MVHRIVSTAALVLLCRFTAVEAVAEVRIAEVMAANSTVLVDEDGEYTDWIELLNPLSQAVALDGYRIADDRNRSAAWMLPDTVIPAQGRLILRASGKNRSDAGYYGTAVQRGAGGLGDSADAVHFEYLPLADTCSIVVRLRSLRSGPHAYAGLMIRDDTTATARSMGVYVGGIGRYIVTARTEQGSGAVRRELTGSADFPTVWLRLYRDRDTLIAHRSVDGYSWHWCGTHVFPSLRDTLYAGIALASFGDVPASATWTDLVVNGTPSPFTGLARRDIGSDLSGSTFRSHELHTDFSLGKSGEAVYLWNAEGVPVDSLVFGPQKADVSCGPGAVDGTTVLLFPATPGAPNGEEYQSVASMPSAEPPAGAYAGPVAVRLTSGEPGAVIRYTVDGSEPTESSSLYEGVPIAVDSTTVVRARVVAPGRLPSDVFTALYRIDEPPGRLPVVSIAGDPVKFWSDSVGIFVPGPNASPHFPYEGANFMLDREVPVHLRITETDGSGTAVDVGAKVHGFGSRVFPQKSLRILARNRYGNDRISYRLFPSVGLLSYNSFLLRNAGNDWPRSFLRDPLAAVTAARLGLDVQAYRPVRAYLNAEYWGLYNLRERVDEYYFADHYGVDPASVDILELMGTAVWGSAKDYLAYLDSLEAFDMSSDGAVSFMERHIDVDNFITYTCAEVIAGNADWPGNNVKLWRSGALDGRWRWVVYDVDAGFGLGDDYTFNTLALAASPEPTRWTNPQWATFLLRRLLAAEPLRHRLINRCADLLNTEFRPDVMLQRLDSLAAAIADEVPLHHARWDSSLADWEAEIDVLREFVRRRPTFVRRHVVEQFALSGTTTVRLDADGEGTVRISTVQPAALPFDGVWFRDVPVRISAVAAPGYRFAGWSDAALPDTPSVDIVFSDSLYELTAVFVQTAPGDTAHVVVNEILYKPADVRDCRDWIELYNAGNGAADLSGWRLRDDRDDHLFTIPAGTVLQAGGFLVLCNDTASFRQWYTGDIRVLGNVGFGFGSDADMVRLYDAAGMLRDSVPYKSTAPWPVGAVGTGASIELLHPDSDNALGWNWRLSPGLFGTPGSANVPVSAPGVAEVAVPVCMPHPVSGTAVVAYTLPKGGQVDIAVYNLAGVVVAELSCGAQNAGEHTTAMDLSHLPDGVYIIRLFADGGAPVVSLPVVVLK